MNAAALLVKCLEQEGVRVIFGVPGEETLALTDALLDARMQVVAARHEQGAAFMADVYGRLSGTAGVCVSTLGPGATNLLTGVADAYLDHAPLVAITGQASLNRRHKESHQYIDVIAMFKPVTKWNASIPRADVVPEAVRKAFKIAQTEKPGATHVELPEDVADQSIPDEAGLRPLVVQAPVMPEPAPSQVQRAVRALSAAKRPVILAGNGVVRGKAADAVRSFARAFHVPVLHTFMAKGVMPDSDPLSLHTLGLTVRDYAAIVMEQADVVVTIGYDFVEYAPCFWNPHRDKHIVHIDSMPAEVDEHYIVDVGVVGDVRLSLPLLQAQMSGFDSSWAPQARKQVADGFEAELTGPPSWPLRPQHIMRELRAVLKDDDIVVCDVGAHKLWMARMFPCETPNSCIISNGFAAMGIAVPGAMAAKLLHPERRVIAVTGDGGFLMNSQELETAVRLKLPLVVLIWRDNGYGVIRWKQQVRFGRTSSVDFGNPDFVRYAESFGAAGYRVTEPGELRPMLEHALQRQVPAVIDCPVDAAENLRLTRRLASLNILILVLAFLLTLSCSGKPHTAAVQDPPSQTEAEEEHVHGHHDAETASSMSDAHAHLGPHFRWTTLRPANQADQATAWDILRKLRQELVKYREYQAAINAGYEPLLPNLQQPHYHFTRKWNGFKAAFSFDPKQPTSLLYKKTPDGYELEGAMFTAPKWTSEEELNKRIPLSVAQWHAHVNVCLPQKRDMQTADWKKFGPKGSILTEAECKQAGGRFMPQLFGWMVHVYPFAETPEKIWTH